MDAGDLHALIKETFRRWDTNGDGKITVGELEAVIRKLSSHAFREPELNELLHKMMSEVDRNGNNQVEYEEFVDWVLEPATRVSIVGNEVQMFDLETVLRPLFDVFDKNGNGKVSYEEFEECQDILKGILESTESMPAVAPMVATNSGAIFAEYDSNRDQTISFEEFIEWQRESIAQSGISTERLVLLVQRVAGLLRSILFLEREPTRKGSRLSERGNLRLGTLTTSAAECFSELWGRSRQGEAQCEGIWSDFPDGISKEKLKLADLRHDLPTQNVTDINLSVGICVPAPPGMWTTANYQAWYGTVTRSITYEGVDEVEKTTSYYVYYNKRWRCFDDGTEYRKALQFLGRDMQLLALLVTESDFSPVQSWDQIHAALTKSVEIGLLIQEQLESFRRKMLDFVLEAVREVSGDPLLVSSLNQESQKNLADAFFQKHVKYSALQVMAVLTEAGVVQSHDVWAEYQPKPLESSITALKLRRTSAGKPSAETPSTEVPSA
eukprot:CAMPEP_0117467902 /NCGR_PEP_ID=MMETSP0784-20121206/5899_1 /TAXON_ID=39447 /ORGANISM="" /LENGTH=495 /DNA_ID=CAMNT_0005261893 /DNA_START=1 /DNA_END=1488 /DNA_ORIENTATION=-